jgi:hypothetical protein
MVAFLRDGLGLAVEFEEEATTELSVANGDRVQVFGPGHRKRDQHWEWTNFPRARRDLYEVASMRSAE